MAIVTINDEHLDNIAEAIRVKSGSLELYKPSEMADAIAAIETGGGSSGICLTGDLTQLFKDLSCSTDTTWAETYYWPHFINENTTTKDITSLYETFYCNEYITEIPFEFNFKEGEVVSGHRCFMACIGLRKAPTINGILGNSAYFFHNIRKLTDISSLETLELADGTRMYFFANCECTRNIPSSFLLRLGRKSYSLNAGFQGCRILDDIKNLGVYKEKTITNINTLFGTSCLTGCSRLSDFTFETNEDGSAIVAPWYAQTIDLSSYVGYASSKSVITNYSSYHGITTSTQVTDDATYQALKNDVNWWTIDPAYSRYNHASAVRTINSLPDTSATVAANGGTNTIKFKSAQGGSTDGGAISTLTEEEIAVATNKGWTVTLA